MSTAHPGFQALVAQGVPAGALANSARRASPAARKANPRLNRVSGVNQPPGNVGAKHPAKKAKAKATAKKATKGARKQALAVILAGRGGSPSPRPGSHAGPDIFAVPRGPKLSPAAARKRARYAPARQGRSMSAS